jgi:hypothetical protein
MSSPTIQRQSILSTMAIVAGFVLGGINMVILFPKVMAGEEFGLTRVVNDFSVIAANFATLGVLPVLYKFFPLYKRYVPAHQNDLPFITITVFSIGIVLTCLILWFFQPHIIAAFGRNNPIFPGYYWLIFPFTIFYATFLFAEPFAWNAGLKCTKQYAERNAVPRIDTHLPAADYISPDCFRHIYGALQPDIFIACRALNLDGDKKRYAAHHSKIESCNQAGWF